MQKSLFHLGDTIRKAFRVVVGSYSTCRSMGCYLENAYFHHWKGTKLWFANTNEIFTRIKVEMSDGKKSIHRTKSRKTHFGRPKFNDLLELIMQENPSTGKIGVFRNDFNKTCLIISAHAYFIPYSGDDLKLKSFKLWPSRFNKKCWCCC